MTVDIEQDRDLWRRLGGIEATISSNHQAINRIGDSLSKHVKGCTDTNLDVQKEVSSLRDAVENQGVSIIATLERVESIEGKVSAMVEAVQENSRVVGRIESLKKGVVDKIAYVIVGAAVLWVLMQVGFTPVDLPLPD